MDQSTGLDWLTQPAPDEHLIPAMPAPLPIRKAQPTDAGCWVDGHWGWRGIGRVAEIAVGCGWPITAEDAETLAQYMSDDPCADDCAQAMHEIADDAEDWLTDNVAPDGYSFGWHDGEFFLWPDGGWCVAARDGCYCVTPHDDNGDPL